MDKDLEKAATDFFESLPPIMRGFSKAPISPEDQRALIDYYEKRAEHHKCQSIAIDLQYGSAARRWEGDADWSLSRFEQACNRVTRYVEVVVPEIKALRRIGAHHKIPRLPAPKLTRSQVGAVFRMVRRDGTRGCIDASALLGNAVAPLLALMVRKDKLAFRQQLVGGAL